MAFERKTILLFYKKLLAFYPRAFRERFAESMEQTFNDLWNERAEGHAKQGLFGFVLWTFVETSAGIIKEQALVMKQEGAMKNITTNPKSAAFIGLLFIVPLIALNQIIGDRIEPFFSLIRPGVHTSPLEYVLLPIVLLLLPVGAFIAARPMLRKKADGERKLYLVNGTLAALLLVVFVLISVAFGSEIYRCEILQIPNCD